MGGQPLGERQGGVQESMRGGTAGGNRRCVALPPQFAKSASASPLKYFANSRWAGKTDKDF